MGAHCLLMLSQLCPSQLSSIDSSKNLFQHGPRGPPLPLSPVPTNDVNNFILATEGTGSENESTNSLNTPSTSYCMVRSIILRFPLIRAIFPRVSRPLLPIAGRLPPALSPLRPRHRLIHSSPQRSPSPPDPESYKLPPGATLTQRLKHLIKSYGWYALGVYFILSAVDFTVAFGAVNVLGAEHVSRVASSIKDAVFGLLNSKPPEPGREDMDVANSHAGSGGHEGLYAMLVLAYTIHKTIFLPVRVGLTAAFTPRLVGWLRQRGWAGGAGTKRAVHEMREKMRDRRQ